ncbi:hypothetical protein [Thermococcus sp. AM4]|uniref:hypothetical protein n=1 Tax=Thermococcus sp. (strain AM4) TaxID=246969 RepID=UPI0001870CD8|nr:hypothetical protein [Thermococcus sp. AM4]EEB74336.1 conserved hypothetical protein [Thermococcus sp. AM4]
MDERLIDVKALIAKGKLDTALLVAESIEEPYWRDYALRWVAEAYARGNPEKAVEIAGMISTDSLRDDALANLSYIFSREGKFKLAIEVARKIRGEFTRKKALRTVSTVLARAIVERGAEISLSELGLDESDVEVLKPLPGGISLKDGKLMPGGEILRMKGEFRNEVVSLTEVRRSPPERPYFEFGTVEAGYLRDYLQLLGDMANVAELEYWAELVEGPLRDELLEEAGLIYLRAGVIEKALELAGKAGKTEDLAYLLALRMIEDGRLGEIGSLSCKIRSPVKKLLVLRELAVRGLLERELAEAVLTPDSDYILARLLKFLAFEMLGEAKKENDPKLLEKSREIFEMGVKIQREYEESLYQSSSSSQSSSSHSSSQSSSSKSSSSQSSSSR